jgi:hypothetical protein
VVIRIGIPALSTSEKIGPEALSDGPGLHPLKQMCSERMTDHQPGIPGRLDAGLVLEVELFIPVEPDRIIPSFTIHIDCELVS